ncbi:hypothetical protein [Phaeovulum sp.]|uniref:hypothetical protein n=1 Tax=Phaeovulum sp. TaxID=2934796 RepID=UPI00272F6D0A|nr:hypothetical protein [Phaeovulum sp.]MDP1670289.1 hypothetical protein [Phaeovulum sp.]MDZ4117958.1 hypothetical protein [Phaeovulum sp.]
MEGMSERQYAAHVGLSRGAIQKAKETGRLVQHADGSIDAIASDARRAAMTDPAKQRGAKAAASPQTARLKPVPDAALSVVGETLREHGLVAPVTNGGTTYLQARTVNEVLKAQERKLKLAQLKGELIDRNRAVRLVFRLARDERDAWVTWPARAAALMASELGVMIADHGVLEPAMMQKVLEAHVRAQLDSLAEVRIDLR